jgi:gliding motility-associated-like protein
MFNVELGKDTAICNGNNFVLNASVNNGNYLWNDNSADSVLKVDSSGVYSVLVSKGSCRYVDSISVNFHSPLNLNLGNDTTLCEGEIFKLKATNTNAVYLWQDNSDDSLLEIKAEGNYYVTVTNSCGSISDDINIHLENCTCFFVPNTFTPDDDGKNDFFSPVYQCEISGYSMTIFNRWGETIFYSEKESEKWNGKYNDENAPAGVYVFELNLKFMNKKENILKHGHVTLIR